MNQQNQWCLETADTNEMISCVLLVHWVYNPLVAGSQLPSGCHVANVSFAMIVHTFLALKVKIYQILVQVICEIMKCRKS